MPAIIPPSAEVENFAAWRDCLTITWGPGGVRIELSGPAVDGLPEDVRAELLVAAGDSVAFNLASYGVPVTAVERGGPAVEGRPSGPAPTDDPTGDVEDPADVRFEGVVSLPSDRRDVAFVAAGVLGPAAAAIAGWVTVGPAGLFGLGIGGLLVVAVADILRGRVR